MDLDSGSTHHMTFSSELFSTYSPYSSIPYITIADGSQTTIIDFEDIDLPTPFHLRHVLRAQFSNNLILIRKLT